MPPLLDPTSSQLDMAAADQFLRQAHGNQNRAGLMLKDYRPNLSDDQVKLLIERATKLSTNRGVDPDSWPELFLALNAWNVKPVVQIVEDLLIETGVHVWAGMFEAYKTMFAIEMCSAILESRPVAGYFPVFSSVDILYLCPDMSPGLFADYAKPFKLSSHGDRFRGLHPDVPGVIAIDDPRLQRAVKGRILFLDTMLDFARIKEASRSGEWIEFFEKLRDLIRVHECRAIVMLAHPTKAGVRNSIIDATEFLKDSITFGGKLDVGLAFANVANTSKIFIERIKGRSFKKKGFTFTVTIRDDAGNSYLDRGQFPIFDKPGLAGKRSDHAGRGGRPSKITDGQREQLKKLLQERDLHGDRLSDNEIGKRLGVNNHTAKSWIAKFGEEQF